MKNQNKNKRRAMCTLDVKSDATCTLAPGLWFTRLFYGWLFVFHLLETTKLQYLQ